MSWVVELYDEHGHLEFETSYTHNVNSMIAFGIAVAGGVLPPICDGPLGKIIGPAWWHMLNDMSGVDGAEYIGLILEGLQSDPDRFRVMNPENGWGDYDSLVELLQEMRDAVPEWPTRWQARG